MTAWLVNGAMLLIFGLWRLSSAFMEVSLISHCVQLRRRPSIFSKDHIPNSNRLLHSIPPMSCHRKISPTKENPSSFKYRVHLAVGSNLGDRYKNIHHALKWLSMNDTVRLVRTSYLYETKPMYIENQSAFLNGAVEIETDLEPLQLLQNIKHVEAQSGRVFTKVRNGPRPVDLDILLFASIGSVGKTEEQMIINTDELTIPHPRISERLFVLIPLIDLAGRDATLPGMNGTLGDFVRQLETTTESGSDSYTPSAVRVLPIPRGRLLYFNGTLIMGILNVTPDSFSDGGVWTSSVEVAVDRALTMEREGAAIVDVGGESTRPGSIETSIEEELRRTIPVIEGIRKVSDVVISIDTRHALVAQFAIVAGADIVNDISGGSFDDKMLSTVSALGVPMIFMHMRGTPENMQSLTSYEDIVVEVGTSLKYQSDIAAEEYSIHKWMQIVDPGIGFAKDLRGNLILLKNIATLRRIVEDLPILIGTSRKGFIGTIASVPKAEDRDPGTLASCVTALCLENNSSLFGCRPENAPCTILRVHNVASCRQAIHVMDAISQVN